MTTKNKKFIVGIRNQVASSGILELHFLDVIEDTYTFDWYYGFEETRIVEEVVNQVKSANPSTILLLIDSEGGDAGKGLAIYNFLKNYKANVESDIIGMAGSIASVIAFAANKGKLRIARNGFMVIHKAWGWGMGNSKDLRAAADVVDKYTDQIVDIYSQRTGRTTDEIHMLIDDGDFWMTGREAQELGFADETFNDNAEFAIAARIGELDKNYKNVPKNLLLQRVKNKTTSTSTEETSSENQEEEQSENAGTEETTPGTTEETPVEESQADETQTEQSEQTDTTIIDKINNTLMNFKERFTTVINSIKNKKIDAKAENLGEQVANLLSEPVSQMAEALQEEVQNEITAVKDSFEERISKLEKVNASLLDTKAALEKEIADSKGTETTPKNSTGETPIGVGVKA